MRLREVKSFPKSGLHRGLADSEVHTCKPCTYSLWDNRLRKFLAVSPLELYMLPPGKGKLQGMSDGPWGHRQKNVSVRRPVRPFARSRKDRRASERASDRSPEGSVSWLGGERPASNLPNPVVLLVEDPCRPQPERNRHRPDGDGDAEDVEAGQHGQQGQDHQRQQRQPAVLRWVAAPGGWGAPRGQGGAAGSLVLSKVCGPAGVRGNGRQYHRVEAGAGEKRQ